MKKYLLKSRNIMLALSMICSSAIYATDFSEILLQIDGNNTQLKSVLSSNSATVEQLHLENTLNSPDVDFSYLFGDKAVGDKWEIGIAQSFEWIGVYHARRKAIEATSQSLNYDLLALRREIHTEALASCIEIVWLNKQKALYTSVVADVDSLLQLSNKAFSHGEVSILDLNKLKIERVSTIRKLNEIKSQLVGVKARLTQLNGGVAIDCEYMTDYPALALPESVSQYVQFAIDSDPKALYFKNRDKANSYGISAAIRSKYPSLSIGYRHVNELGDKFNGVTAGISIPIYRGNKSVKEARAKAIAESYEENLWMSEVKTELEKEFVLAKQYQDELAMYDLALPANNVALLNKALNAGHISLVEYLLEKRFYSEALMERLEVEYRYQMSLNNINRYNY